MKYFNAKFIKLCVVPAFAFLLLATYFHVSTANDALDAKSYFQKYAITMNVWIPRVYDNMNSLGYRKYERQRIKGNLQLEYDSDGNMSNVSSIVLTNFTHRMSDGSYVTYEGYLNDSMPCIFVAIGSNKSNIFRTTSICFSIVAEPSYNIGEVDEDTSLYITLSGKGNIRKSQIGMAQGLVSGTIGCGCYAYGHISPTRTIWWWGVSSNVIDIASVYGNWCIRQR